VPPHNIAASQPVTLVLAYAAIEPGVADALGFVIVPKT
jgi:hypothetical protein